MSVKIKRCPKCGEKTEFSAFSNNPDILKCCACNFNGNRGVFEAFIPAIFDRITQSPEALADTYMFNHDGKVFKSLLLPNMVFNSRAEAHAATVAKLKEVAE